MAQFWAAALGYRIDDDGQHLWPPPEAGPHAPSVVAAARRRADSAARTAVIRDLVAGSTATPTPRWSGCSALGARRVEIGQAGTEGFVVLADPEGNEFCVLR